jgi:ribonuclease HI
MTDIKLFTDGSVNPQAKIGYGAYLLVSQMNTPKELLEQSIKTYCFTNTSSTKLELQTLLWALKEIQTTQVPLTIYTDSQNTITLLNRRQGFEAKGYLTSKGKLIANHELYKEFYTLTDKLDCSFVKLEGHKREEDRDELDEIFVLVDRASREALRKN